MRIASQVENNMIKVCIKCGKEKPLSDFSKDKYMKSGYKSSCKECNRKKYSIDTTITSKVCKCCGQEKIISEFNKDTSNKTGYRNECKECQYKNHKKTIYIKKCKVCGKEFTAVNNKAKYCEGCKFKSMENNITFKCEFCGEERTIPKSHYNRNKHHYCGKECRQKARINPNITEEEREKRKNRKQKVEGYDDFIKGVYKRDHYTCQCCGYKKSGNIVAHHLNGYNWDIEHRIDINNAVTLCEDCHKEFHSIYGYGNNTKEQFEEFLNNKTNKSA